jgi:hypothetical protein
MAVAQYGFILLRTRQGAAYLESRAWSLTELYRVVTAERYADSRFAFTWHDLVFTQLPRAVSAITQDRGWAASALLVLGVGRGDQEMCECPPGRRRGGRAACLHRQPGRRHRRLRNTTAGPRLAAVGLWTAGFGYGSGDRRNRSRFMLRIQKLVPVSTGPRFEAEAWSIFAPGATA